MARFEHDWFSRPVPSNVEIGARSWLYSAFAFVHYRSKTPVGVRIGCDSGIYHGTFFDLGRDGCVEIGDYCSLVGPIFATNGHVTIGDYTLIAHEVVIADSMWGIPPGDGQTAASSSPATAHQVHIGRNVWIGARAVIAGSVRIGDNAIIGAATIVTTDVPPNVVCAGNPMRIIRTLSP